MFLTYDDDDQYLLRSSISLLAFGSLKLNRCPATIVQRTLITGIPNTLIFGIQEKIQSFWQKTVSILKSFPSCRASRLTRSSTFIVMMEIIVNADYWSWQSWHAVMFKFLLLKMMLTSPWITPSNPARPKPKSLRCFRVNLWQCNHPFLNSWLHRFVCFTSWYQSTQGHPS